MLLRQILSTRFLLKRETSPQCHILENYQSQISKIPEDTTSQKIISLTSDQDKCN